MSGPSPVDVVVVIPARDEQRLIGTCVESVRQSLAHAVERGRVGTYAIVVVAHRCADATASAAAAALAGAPHRVLVDLGSDTVGQVRAAGVAAAVDLLDRVGHSPDPARTWVLNTDADTVVPPTWICDVLSHTRHGAVAVVGLTALAEDPPMSPSASDAYRAIILRGLHGRSHDHVYGANLAVRLDAYHAVGGFAAVPVGEDQALVDSLSRQGFRLARPVNVVVTTSGRRHGRATGGLADLLARLDSTTDRDRDPAAATARALRLRTKTPVPAPGMS